jgi:hypothetical protein
LNLEGEPSTGVFSPAAGSLGLAVLGQLALLLSSQAGVRIPSSLAIGDGAGSSDVDLAVSGLNGRVRITAPNSGPASLQLLVPGGILHELECSRIDGGLRLLVNGVEVLSVATTGSVTVGKTTSGSQALLQSANGLNIQGVPNYSNTAEAVSGGLVPGDLFYVGAGELRIVP